MENVCIWLCNNFSSTAVLKPHQDGYRDLEGCWIEPIPTTKNWKYDRIKNIGKHDRVMCLRQIDVHNEKGVFEKIEHDGQVFYVCKAIVFNAKDYDITEGNIDKWAKSHDMDLQVLPKELSNHPSRTFCIAKPRNRCDFFATFRAWLISKQYDTLHDRSLCEGAPGTLQYFYDILYCHDYFFTSLGTRKHDFCRLCKWHCVDYNNDAICVRALKNLWSKYLWKRCSVKMIYWARFASVLLKYFHEVAVRPGNSAALAAKRSFETMSSGY